MLVLFSNVPAHCTSCQQKQDRRKPGLDCGGSKVALQTDVPKGSLALPLKQGLFIQKSI